MRVSDIENDELKRWFGLLVNYEGANKEKAKELLHLVAVPRRRRIALNINEIDKKAGENESIVVPGKVLGLGTPSKRFEIAAVSFSESARKKLEQAGCIVKDIRDLLQKDNLKIVK